MASIGMSQWRAGLLFGAAAIALATASGANAQDGAAVPDADEADASGNEVIVTGSRLAKAGFDAPSPTTTLNAESLAQRAVSNIGQITDAIPSFLAVTTPASTSLTSARAGGSYLNLRGLGDNRTLVLANNRRIVPTNPEGTVDTNIIPRALVGRIEVVTGGASAAYGSDAVAGVVNIILRDDLDGFEAEAQAGISTHGDNETYYGSVAWGTSLGDRGNFAIAVEGETNKGVGFQTERDWGRGGFAEVFTGGNPPARVLPDVQFSLQTLGGLVLTGVNAGTDFGPGGVPRPFVSGVSDGFFQSGGSGVVASDFVSLTVPYDRWSAFAQADYDFGGVRGFIEASYAYSQGTANVLPPSNFGSIVIQRDNAFLDPGLAAAMDGAGETSFRLGRFSPDYGLLTSQITNKTTRIAAGFDGEISPNVTWQVYGQYGKTDSRTDRGNNAVVARFNRAVDAVIGTGGAPVCRVNANASTADDDPACVPVNLFGAGSPSQAALDYFLGTSRLDTDFEQWVLAGQINADLFDLNGEAVSLAVGGEYRDESVAAVADPLSQANAFVFGNPKSLAGDRSVKEAFAEVLVPLLRDSAVGSLDFNGAIRFTDYSGGTGSVTTWKAGATWDIIEDIRLRGTLSRDIRAPSLSELFATSNLLLATINDAGVTRAVDFVTGGNPNLRAEEADTWALGVVVTPRFLPGLRFSVDYFDISIKDAIATLPAQEIVNRCAAGNTDLCDLIVFDTGGAITRINAAQVNVAEIATNGIDFELAYTTDLGSGQLGLRGLATWVDELRTTNGAVSIDRAGDVGPDNGGIPHWRFNLASTYETGPFSLFLEGRYVGGGKYDVTRGPGDVDLQDIDGRFYVNLGGQARIDIGTGQELELFVNVNNLFDRDPPIVPSTFIAPPQTNQVLYDVIGRMFRAGVRVRY